MILKKQKKSVKQQEKQLIHEGSSYSNQEKEVFLNIYLLS